MQFKKLAAMAGTALMTGLAISAPVLASTVTELGKIGDMVTVTDSTVSFPLVVVGADAKTSDVAGAVNIAVKLAGNAKTTTSVSAGGQQPGIAGGATFSTSSNPIVPWEAIASSRQTFTSSELANILPAGTYTDNGGLAYAYSQYLEFTNAIANGQVVYDRPSGGDSPELGLKVTQNNDAFNYKFVFTKQFSSTTDASYNIESMTNTQIALLGKTYTITTAKSTTSGKIELTMLAGKTSQTVTTESPTDYIVDDATYTVELIAVGSLDNVDAVTIKVTGATLASGGETLQIKNGQTKTLSDGTVCGATSIFRTTKTGAIDSATIFVGADKVEMTDATITDSTYDTTFKVNGKTVDGVSVRITGSGGGASSTIYLNTIEVKYRPTTEQFMKSGESLTDPAFGAFKLYFGGIVPAIDDTTSREDITITPSGSKNARLGFTNKAGKAIGVDFANYTGTGDAALADTAGYALHVVEGASVAQNEYVVVSQSQFGHVLQLLTANPSSTGTTKFKDIGSGDTVEITGGNTSMYLDGQLYYVSILNSSATDTDGPVQITWGAGSGYSNTSYNVDVYPVIESAKGALIAITDDTGAISYNADASNITTVNLPTGSYSLNWTAGASGFQTVGKAKYEITSTGATSFAVNASDNAASPTAYTDPAILIKEELGDIDSAYYHVVMVQTNEDTTNYRVVLTVTPAFTSTTTSAPGVGATNVNKYMDRYGTLVTQNTLNQGRVDISYPDNQAMAGVGVGESPSMTTTGGGTVTADKVLPVTADVVKLDTEVTATDKTAYDMILLGSPAVNRLSWEILVSSDMQATYPYPVYGYQWSDAGVPISENKAIIKLVKDGFTSGKTVLVVAGWEADDTDLAARVVQDGTKLSGVTKDTVTVSGTSIADVIVS